MPDILNADLTCLHPAASAFQSLMERAIEGQYSWAQVSKWSRDAYEAEYSIILKDERMIYILLPEGLLAGSISTKADAAHFRWKRLFSFSEISSRTEAVVGPIEQRWLRLAHAKSRIVGERFFFSRGFAKEAFVLKYPPDGNHEKLQTAVDFSTKVKGKIQEFDFELAS